MESLPTGLPRLFSALVDFSAVLALDQSVSNFPFQTVRAVFRRTAYR
jgi:hypothetical protein